MPALADQIARARAALPALAAAGAEGRRRALDRMAAALRREAPAILAANARDLADADARGISAALRDRLALDPARVEAMARAVEAVAAQEDPVGQVLESWTRPNGLRVSRVRLPLGLIGLIYEARPNVTSDGAALCLKAGNAVILRGGSEARASNRAIAGALAAALDGSPVPADAVQLLDDPDRDSVRRLVQSPGLDLVVPRGGEGLVRTVAEHARVPVLYHAQGVCHVYVDAAADFDQAVAITVNAKAQRPGVCNAAEKLLIHAAVAPTLLPRLGAALEAARVELRADEAARALLPGAAPATTADWDEEYLDLILAVRVVASLDEALAHIRAHGSGHTEAIVTEDPAAAERFLREVDASCVLHNASTRFNDGGELGLGAELGISTTKFHAYGPVGARDLTAVKYVVRGQGQVRG